VREARAEFGRDQLAHQELGQLEGPLACAQARRVGADAERAVVEPHRRDAARRRADHGVVAREAFEVRRARRAASSARPRFQNGCPQQV